VPSEPFAGQGGSAHPPPMPGRTARCRASGLGLPVSRRVRLGWPGMEAGLPAAPTSASAGSCWSQAGACWGRRRECRGRPPARGRHACWWRWRECRGHPPARGPAHLLAEATRTPRPPAGARAGTLTGGGGANAEAARRREGRHACGWRWRERRGRPPARGPARLRVEVARMPRPPAHVGVRVASRLRHLAEAGRMSRPPAGVWSRSRLLRSLSVCQMAAAAPAGSGGPGSGRAPASGGQSMAAGWRPGGKSALSRRRLGCGYSLRPCFCLICSRTLPYSMSQACEPSSMFLIRSRTS